MLQLITFVFTYVCDNVKMGENLRRPAPFATSYMVGREDKRAKNRTMFLASKNAAEDYDGPVKLELWKVAGLL